MDPNFFNEPPQLEDQQDLFDLPEINSFNPEEFSAEPGPEPYHQIDDPSNDLKTKDTKGTDFCFETMTASSTGNILFEESIMQEEEKSSEMEEKPLVIHSERILNKICKTDKIGYNYISRVFPDLKKNINMGRYELDLWEYPINTEDFYFWLKDVKYNGVKVCKEVWRHKRWNNDRENNFKLALTLITKKFLEDGGAKEWIERSVRNNEYKKLYKEFERRLLKGMRVEYPEFISFKMEDN